MGKAFDRAVTRRTNVKFDPSQTIAILKLGQPDSELNDEQKLDLVKKYMDFKDLMNRIDPDEDEDEEGNPVPSTKPATSYVARAPEAKQLAKQYNNNTTASGGDLNTKENTDGPASSNHQPHQQAWAKYQEEQKKLQTSQPQKEPRESRSRESSKSSSHHRDRDHHSSRDHHGSRDHKDHHSSRDHKEHREQRESREHREPRESREHRDRGSSRTKSNHSSSNHNDYSGPMVLDPMTGEMIPDPDAGNEEEWDEEANLSGIQPVTIKLGFP